MQAIKFHAGFKKYAANTAYLFLEKILRSLIVVFVWAKVIRYLGPEQFGIFSYALSLVFLFSIVADLGLKSVVVKNLVERRVPEDCVLGSTFILQGAGALTAILLIWMVTTFMSTEVSLQGTILFMSLRLVFQAFDCIDFFFQSRVRSKYVVFAQIISLMITAVLCLVFVGIKLGLAFFVFISVFEVAVAAGGLIFFYIRTGGRLLAWRVDPAMVRGLLQASWPLILSGAAVSIFQRIDQVMLKLMVNADAVGRYAAVVRVSEAFHFIPVIVVGSFFPAIVRSRVRDRKVYRARLEALFTGLTWIAIFSATVLTLGAHWIMQFLYGSEFASAAGTLIVLIWTSVFVFLAVARTQWAINEDLQIYVLIYTSLGALVNIVLNWILIPRYSIEGAAYATLISYFCSAILCNAFSPRTREIFYIQLQSFNIFKGLRARMLSAVMHEH